MLPRGRTQDRRRPARSVGRRAAARPGLAAALAAGCASGSTAGAGGRSAAARCRRRDRACAGYARTPIVVQTSWFSQVEHFVAYQLLGGGYTGRRRPASG